jgi:hypothetical protein
VSNIQFSIVSSGEDAFVTAFVPGEAAPLVAAKSGHPNFEAIVGALTTGTADRDEIVNLFDVSKAVAEKFEAVSERVIVTGGHVLFDGAEIDNSLTNQIVRFLDEGEDFGPLVRFMENVMDNPNEHSREQLYDWLRQRDFTITWHGFIVAYKGVASDDKHGYRSISSGREPVYVEDQDGNVERYTGRIPNPVGATISMDRALVQHDPSVGCHVGLHVGTFDYAKSFSHGTVLEVHVNPRDVVSVPTDCDWAKVRTCRYTVVDAISTPYTTGLVDPDGVRDDDEDEPEWEDYDY